MPLQVGCAVQYKNTWYIRTECKIVKPENYRLGLIMGPNITCRALVLKTTDPAQCMYIGNLNKKIWALNTYIGSGPEVLSLDRPTIYNHAPRTHRINGCCVFFFKFWTNFFAENCNLQFVFKDGKTAYRIKMKDSFEFELTFATKEYSNASPCFYWPLKQNNL